MKLWQPDPAFAGCSLPEHFKVRLSPGLGMLVMHWLHCYSQLGPCAHTAETEKAWHQSDMLMISVLT